MIYGCHWDWQIKSLNMCLMFDLEQQSLYILLIMKYNVIYMCMCGESTKIAIIQPKMIQPCLF